MSIKLDHDLIQNVLDVMESFFGADLSQVRIREARLPQELGAEAFTCGEHIVFAPGKLEVSSYTGLALLGHELAHVLQQRSIKPSSQGLALLYDPILEAEADILGRRAAEFVLRHRVAGRRDRHRAMDDSCLEAAAGMELAGHDKAIGKVIQCRLEIGGEKYETGIEPLSSWGLTPEQKTFYKYLLQASDRTFYFRDKNHMLGFVKDQNLLGVYKNTTNITGSHNLKYFEKIATATYTNIEKRDTTWSANIKVRTNKGSEIIVHVFTSVKRHLISSFMRSQMSPRDRKEDNVVVKDAALFESKLIDYARYHANQIKNNMMLFGYNPKAADAGHHDAEIKFITDIIIVPSPGWPYENPIHAFPESGTAVKTLTREEYHALATFLLWFFRTEEHKAEGERFNRINRMTEVKRAQEEKNVQKSIREALKHLTSLKDGYGVVLPVLEADVKATAKNLEETFIKATGKKPEHYNKLLPPIAQSLHYALSVQGFIPAIDKPYIAAKDKAAGIKVVSSSITPPDVRFKTHKIEVKAQLPNLTPELVAWAIDGHTGVAADQILLAISTSNKAKAHVKQQINEAEKNLFESFRPTVSLEDKVRKVNSFVKTAVDSKVL